MKIKKSDRGSWVIGGMIIVGVGVGLIFIQSNPILMAASILIGIGLGLVIAPIISGK